MKKQKYNHWIFYYIFFFIAVFFTWIIFGFSTNNPDYRVYESWYNFFGVHGFVTRFEWGFSYAMLFANKLNLTYQEFLQIFSGIGLFLLAKSIYRYCKYPLMCWGLYFIYPFFFDVVQIRNFIATVIVIYGLRFLEELNKKNVICYVITILIASTFHIIALVYLSFMLVYIKDFGKIVKLCLVILICGLIGLEILPKLFKSVISRFVNLEYILVGSTLTKVSGYVLVSMFIVLMIYLYYYKMQKKPSAIDCNYLVKVIPVMLVMCLAVALSSQGYRLIRNMSIILYIALLNAFGSRKGIKFTFYYNQIIMLVIAIAFAIFFYNKHLAWGTDMYDYVIRSILESNMLFNLK